MKHYTVSFFLVLFIAVNSCYAQFTIQQNIDFAKQDGFFFPGQVDRPANSPSNPTGRPRPPPNNNDPFAIPQPSGNIETPMPPLDINQFLTPPQNNNNQPPPQRPTINQFPTQKPTINQFPTQRPAINQFPTQKPTINQFPTQRPTINQFPTQRPTINQFPTQRPTINQFPTQRPTINQFPTQRPTINQFPTQRPGGQRTTVSPSTTQDPMTSPSLADYVQCLSACQATSEYNPVCATDGEVYSNPGRLNCAVNCGNPIQMVRFGQCPIPSPPPSQATSNRARTQR